MTTDSDAPGKPVGIRDVAKAVGVSVATASLAINGQPGVAEETRRRIVAAARAARLPRQPAGAGAAPGAHHDLRLCGAQLRQPVLPRGAQRGAAGRRATPGPRCSSSTRATRSSASAGTCRNWRRSGWTGWPSPRSGPASRYGSGRSLRPGAPAVALNASAEGVDGICRVSPDNAAAVELPMRRLAELGHESVAFLSAPRQLMADPDRLRHFRRLARELGLRPRIMYSPLTIADVQQAARGAAGRARRAHRDHHELRLHGARGLQGGARAIAPGRARRLGRRPRRPAHLGTARPAAGDHPDGPPGHGPRADAAAAGTRPGG